MALADHAERFHAVASTAELRALGLSSGAITRRVRSGRLHPLHRGVFAIGHRRLTLKGRWRAAVLACGPGAALSHRDAGALHRVRPSSRRRIDVTTPNRGTKKKEGIDVHRVRHLDPRDVTVIDGIPVTTLARTLVDLAEVVDRNGVAKAVRESERLRTFDLKAVDAAIARANGRRRVGVLRALLEDHAIPPPTRSDLQDRFLKIVTDAGLPAPLIDTEVEADDRTPEVDFLWPAQRLVVETDGAETHLTRHAFEDDRERDAALLLEGYRVVRFTWRRVVRRPDEVVRVLRKALAMGGALHASPSLTSHQLHCDDGPDAASARPWMDVDPQARPTE